MQDFLAQLAGRTPAVLSILAFRVVPFIAYAVFSARVRLGGKLLALTLFAGLTALVFQLGGNVTEPLLRTPVALGYFALAACAVFALRDGLAAKRLSKPALFALIATMYVMVPALLVPSAAVLATLVIGWEAMLAGYSYCVDNAGARQRPALRECLFFMLVNPTLVYAERGERVAEPALRARPLGRVALGVATMLGQDALLLAAQGLALQPGDPTTPSGFFDFGFAAVQTARGVGLYLAHSGLASMQIGLMGLAGYRIPERYDFPILATGPADFWRRWNIWLGAWAKRYLYFPAALNLGRRWRERPSELAKGAALGLTFVAIGLLHDFATYWSSLHELRAPRVPYMTTVAFTVMVLMFLLWMSAGLLRKRRERPRPVTRTRRWVTAVLSWAAFMQLMHLVLWISTSVAPRSASLAPPLEGLLTSVKTWLP